jgi:predicted dienelactone hydrolase
MVCLRRIPPVVLVSVALLSTGCSSGSSTRNDAPVDPPDMLGSYAVGHAAFIAEDPDRSKRSILIDVWYPVDEADAAEEPRTQYPLAGAIMLTSDVAVEGLPIASSAGPLALLVFSHGYGGINTQSTQLMESLASHGFIVASPEHTGNTAFDQSDEMPELQRVPDVSFVIDTLLDRSATGGDLFEGRVDGSEVGVLGHSFGGMTAMGAVAGLRGTGPDPRVSAIGVIAGSVGGERFSDEALASVDEPTILLVGTLDPGALENHRHAFARMPNAEALFTVEIEEANHTHFANVCDLGNLLLEIGITQDAWPNLGAEALIGPYDETCTDEVFPIAEAHRLQSLYMTAHFKRYLLGQRGYERYLSAEYAEENEASVRFEAQ